MADPRTDRFLRQRASNLARAALAVAITTVFALVLASPVIAAAVQSQADQGKPPLDKPEVPVRIRVPDLGVDLPVVSSERTVPGNTRDYPLCDVAQYWTIYDLPGAPGTTWIYAHAQPGMFLPLLVTANATGGAGLVGKLVTLQLRDGRVLRYRIDEVKQHAYNRGIALLGRPKAQRIVLQTSEGPPGTIPKLQVSGKLVGAGWTDKPAPKARPRACWQPRAAIAARGGRPSGDKGGKATSQQRKPKASPEAVVAATGGGGDVDPVSLAFGGAAVLLGATLFAVYLVRRPPASSQPPRPRPTAPPRG